MVYGVGRDQGMTSKTTVAILAAAANKPYTIPFRGPISWLHAGEVASAFIRAVAKERTRCRYSTSTACPRRSNARSSC